MTEIIKQLKAIRQKHLDKITFLKCEDTSTEQGAEGVYTAIAFHERAVKNLDSKIEELIIELAIPKKITIDFPDGVTNCFTIMYIKGEEQTIMNCDSAKDLNESLEKIKNRNISNSLFN